MFRKHSEYASRLRNLFPQQGVTTTGKFTMLPHIKAKSSSILFPVTDYSYNLMKPHAIPSPFGLKDKTLIDSNVRKSFEIPGHDLTISKNLTNYIHEEIIPDIETVLDVKKVRAELYKMILYQPGDFFIEHKDTLRAKENFGTLVITLPGNYEGGALVVKHQGVEKEFFAKGNAHEFEWSAFYTDCPHRVETLTSGHRVCLTYNLFATPDTLKSVPTKALSPNDEAIMEQILNEAFDTLECKHIALLLTHMYGKEQLHPKYLKGTDVIMYHHLAKKFNVQLESAKFEIYENGDEYTANLENYLEHYEDLREYTRISLSCGNEFTWHSAREDNDTGFLFDFNNIYAMNTSGNPDSYYAGNHQEDGHLAYIHSGLVISKKQ